MDELLKFKKSIKILTVSVFFLIFLTLYASSGDNLVDPDKNWPIYISILSYGIFLISFWFVAVKIYSLTRVFKKNCIVKSHPAVFVILWIACAIIPVILHIAYFSYLLILGKRLALKVKG